MSIARWYPSPQEGRGMKRGCLAITQKKELIVDRGIDQAKKKEDPRETPGPE